ncbi:MAG: AAA family ATPase [bacterium]
MKKKIPYAIASFEKLKETNDYFYIDKTRFIEEIEKYNVPVFLRPRRFGKSLWCSLLECYYDINRKDKFGSLFHGLYIGQNPTPDRNKNLVLRLDFSKVEVKPDVKYIEDRFFGMFRNAISEFIASYKEYLFDFSIDSNIKSSVELLETILSQVKSKKLPAVYLIIDEYDNFTNQLITSHQDGLYYALTTTDSFFRTFFKVIKAGVGERSIERVFITGVLPITMDDLTSGFNIAQFITLKKNTLNMLGFTQIEVDQLTDKIYEIYGFNQDNLPEIRRILIENYNGYKFLPTTEESLYNPTILNYFLNELILNDGEIPEEVIDENLRTDLNWVKRLTQREENTKEMLETLLFEKELDYDKSMISSKFNMNHFFEKNFYPLSLFYLGMLTIKNKFKMHLPNLTMKKIFTEYFNIVENIEVSKGYSDIFERFLADTDIEKLFQGYWDIYVKQFPAQIFDKMNENFYRITFYELCSRYLSYDFTLSVENNYPSGRSDWEMLGKFHTKYRHQKYLIEFKYYSNTEGTRLKILKLKEAFQDHIEKVKAYEKDIQNQFPYFKIKSYLIYIVGNKGFKCFGIPF